MDAPTRVQHRKNYLEAVASVWEFVGDEDARILLTQVFVMLEAVQNAQPSPLAARQEFVQTIERLAHAGLNATSKQEHTDPPAWPLTQVLGTTRHLVLLGEPGAGKTTTLQYLGLCFARQAEHWPSHRLELDERCIPIWLNLPTIAAELENSDRQLLEALAREVSGRLSLEAPAGRELIEHWAQEYELLVLLDGLDEVPDNLRGPVRDKISRFALAPIGKQARLILASRPAGFTSLGHPFKEYVLKPFQRSEEVRPFLQSWLTALKASPEWDDQRGWQEAGKLIRAFQEQPGLRHLLDNPLMLKIAAETYVRTGAIARARAGLYEDYIKEVWARARIKRGLPQTFEVVTNVSEALAWHFHLGGAGGEDQAVTAVLKYGDEKNKNTASLLVDSLHRKMGLLASHNARLIFSHTSLQEFFVAKRLVRAWSQDPVRTWKFLTPRLHLPEWREPLALFAGALDRAAARDFFARLTARPANRLERRLNRRTLLAIELCVELENGLALLLPFLHSPVEAIRVRSLAILKKVANPRAQSTLVTLLEEDNWDIRRAALEALGEIHSPEIAALLLSRLNQDESLRYYTSQALLKVIEPEDFALLAQANARARQQEDEKTRRGVAELLQKIPRPEAVELLREALQDKHERVRAAAAQSLGASGDQGVIPALIEHCYDSQAPVQQAALLAIGRLAEPQAAPAVLLAIVAEPRTNSTEGQRQIRESVATMLGQFQSPEALAALLQFLGDESKMVQLAAVNALGLQANPQAAPALITSLNERPEEALRIAIIEALGRIGVSRATPEIMAALIKAMEDEVWDVGAVAMNALKKIPEPQVTEKLIELLEHSEKVNIRRAAAEALGKIGGTRAVEKLLLALHDKDDDVRRTSLEALSQLPDQLAHQQALQAFPPLLKDRNEYVRRAALLAIGETNHAAFIKLVLPLLRDEFQVVRLEAAHTLGKMTDAQAIQILLAHLNDRHRNVREASAQALGRIQLVIPEDRATRQVRIRQLHQAVNIVRPTQSQPAILNALLNQISTLELIDHPWQDPLLPPPVTTWQRKWVWARTGLLILITSILLAFVGLILANASDLLGPSIKAWFAAQPAFITWGIAIGLAVGVSILGWLIDDLRKRL